MECSDSPHWYSLGKYAPLPRDPQLLHLWHGEEGEPGRRRLLKAIITTTAASPPSSTLLSPKCDWCECPAWPSAVSWHTSEGKDSREECREGKGVEDLNFIDATANQCEQSDSLLRVTVRLALLTMWHHAEHGYNSSGAQGIGTAHCYQVRSGVKEIQLKSWGWNWQLYSGAVGVVYCRMQNVVTSWNQRGSGAQWSDRQYLYGGRELVHLCFQLHKWPVFAALFVFSGPGTTCMFERGRTSFQFCDMDGSVGLHVFPMWPLWTRSAQMWSITT